MTQEEIQHEVCRTLADTFELDIDSIRPESRLLEDLDLDSIDAIDIAVKLQDVVGRRIKEDELHGMRTVGDVTALVTRCVDPQRLAA